MARAKGFQGIIARKKGATWGTAIAAGALDGLEVTSIDPGDSGTEPIEDQQITGRVTQREASPGIQTTNFNYATGLRYEGNEVDGALLMGTAGTPTTVDTSAKLHVFKIKDNMDGIFATIAYEYLKDTFVAEIVSGKWKKITISAQAGQRVQLKVEGIGFQWTNGSAVNTTTTIDTVTLPANREFALFAQAVMLMNAQGGGSLAGSDAVHITGFEIVIERNFEARVSTQFGDRPDEPIDKDFAKVTGSFTVPAVQNNSPGGNTAFDAEQVTLTRKKMTLALTSPTLAGATTAPYFHKFWFPNVQLGKGRPGIPGPEGPTRQYPFMAWHVTAQPTGFTAGYVDAMTWENQSQRATDALA